MRYLSSIPVIFMVGLALYAFWDLKINEFKPPVPADQLGEKSAEVTTIMSAHREALKTDMSSNIVPQIEDSLTTISEEYGAESPEYNQALVETALMLNENARADLAEEYMAKAVEVSRLVYGTDHRETALSLNDLANLNTDARNQDYSEDAIKHLREALQIRRTVLEADHQELLVNQVNLADQLFLEWQATGSKSDVTALDEASTLLSEVKGAYERQGEDANPMDQAAVGLLFARIAFYRDDFETAAENFGERLAPVTPETDPAAYMVFTNSYAEYIVSLKKTGREEEAKAMQQDIVKYLRATQEPQATSVAVEVPQPAAVSAGESENTSVEGPEPGQ